MSDMLAFTLRAIDAISLTKEIFDAKNALEAYLINSDEVGSVTIIFLFLNLR